MGGRLGSATNDSNASEKMASAEPGQMMYAQYQSVQGGGQQQQGQGGFVQREPSRVNDIVMATRTLVFRSAGGNPIMVLSDTPQGATLWLADGAGNPSVGLMAGSAGQVVISGVEAGGAIKASAPRSNTYALLSGSEAEPSLKLMLKGKETLALSAMNSGASIAGSDDAGKKLFEMKAEKSAGVLNLLKTDGKKYLSITHTSADGPLLTLFGDRDAQKLELKGEGKVEAQSKGEVVAVFPTKVRD